MIATLGENDEESIAAAVSHAPTYIGVIASRRRFAILRAGLLARGLAAEQLAAIHNPAGLGFRTRGRPKRSRSACSQRLSRRATAPSSCEPWLVLERQADPPPAEAVDRLPGT